MNRLWVRLSLAFLLIAWVSIGAMAWVIQQTTAAGFIQYVHEREQHGITATESGHGEQHGAANNGQGMQLGQQMQAQALGAAEEAFLANANQTLLVVAVITSILAILIGVVLAWLLTRPLQALTRGVELLNAGHLGAQLPPQGTTETVALAKAFNGLSCKLADGETLRQRMAADIAHELRTPVSVLRGHLDAMRDGVFPLDQAHLAVAYDQTLVMGRLVDDLRLLTLAEAGHLPLEKANINAESLVETLVEGFMPLALDAGIDLSVHITPNLPPIVADAVRVRQILGNLLTNALRHTPEGGKICVQVDSDAKNVCFRVCNTGSHLSTEEASAVFQPFWRADASRERDRGGSGLGLAIAQGLVALHQGRIWVETQHEEIIFAFTLPALL